MAAIQAFRESEERIYRERFRRMAPQIRKEGFKADPVFANQRSGVLIAFLPDPYTAWCMRQVIASVNTAVQAYGVPVSVYGAEVFHSTISGYQATDGAPVGLETRGSTIDDTLQPAIAHAIKTLPRITRNRCAIKYHHRLLCNPTTVIAPGEPNEEWLLIVERLIARCKNAGITLRKPWGAHMTLARFTANYRPSSFNGFLGALAKINPDAVLRPRSIGIGIFTCSTDGDFRVDWRCKIQLR